MTTTIRQVAAAAGVSVATASRALSGSEAVIQPTRDRVLQVAAELDYSVSRLARSLVTGSTGNIGVILPDVTNRFYVSFLGALESVFASRDLGILIGDSHEDSARELSLLRRMASQVDAIVLASSRLADSDILSAVARTPIVLANRALDATVPVPQRMHQVVADAERGFTDAATYLHSLGHTDLVYLDGPRRSWSARQKRRILGGVCAEIGMSLRTLRAQRPDFPSGLRALPAILATGTRAVITFNDELALGLLSGLRQAHIEVPDELSVIGCDDSLPEGLAWPGLTTVDSSPAALGELTAAAVIDPTRPATIAVPTRLIIRQSTGRPLSKEKS